MTTISGAPPVVTDRDGIDQLLGALRRRGHEVIGPTRQQQAIAYDVVESVEDLPVGWTDEQDAGTYRLVRRDDDALFGYVVGPHSWKRYLLPPRTRLWAAERDGDAFRVVEGPEEPPRYAFLAVRACELAAIAVQDRVFLRGEHVDTAYSVAREDVFFVAVNCTEPGGTCFCTSMGTGPRVTGGYDLAITEVLSPQGHWFLVETGTERGAEVLAEVDTQPAGGAERKAATNLVDAAALRMGREMDTDGIKDLLYRNFEHERWNDVASRCLSCTNCTMVCPTCFCTQVTDVTDVTGDHAERVREWDSCFTVDFTHLTGGPVRPSTRSRYRQWMTHKLATWWDQFGTSGCVGCGRCITWCPVGIDITEELAAIRGTDDDAHRPGKDRAARARPGRRVEPDGPGAQP